MVLLLLACPCLPAVEEKGGFIWLFYGSKDLPAEERPPIPYVPELGEWQAGQSSAVLGLAAEGSGSVRRRRAQPHTANTAKTFHYKPTRSVGTDLCSCCAPLLCLPACRRPRVEESHRGD